MVVRTRHGQRIHASETCYSLHCRCRPEAAAVERQRAYGYLRAHLLICTSEVNRTKDSLTRFAKDSNLVLAAIFVEEHPRRPDAFERLLQAVLRDEVRVVLLPSFLHLAVLGSPRNVKGYFEAATGARIITMP